MNPSSFDLEKHLSLCKARRQEEESTVYAMAEWGGCLYTGGDQGKITVVGKGGGGELQVVSRGTIYHISVIPVGNSVFLVCAGTGGVKVFDIMEINRALDSSLEGEGCWCKSIKCDPVHFLKTHPSTTEEFIEINSVAWDGKVLYGAGGDTFGAYRWDLESGKLLGNMGGYNKGYLHTVTAVPDTNLLVCGGEDGLLDIWDANQAKHIQSVDPRPNLRLAPNALLRSTWSHCSPAFVRVVGHHETRSGTSGFQAHVHIGTRTVTSCTLTENPLNFCIDDGSHILTVGTGNKLDYCNRAQASIEASTPIDVPCGFAIQALGKDRIAVAGACDCVDIIRDRVVVDRIKLGQGAIVDLYAS